MAQLSDYFTPDIGGALPEGYGARAPITDPLANAVIGAAGIPKRFIDEAKRAPAPGLRREDFTDIPPDTSPDPNSLLGRIGIKVPRQGAEPIDPMIGASFDTAGLVAGAPLVGAPEAGAGEMVLGSGAQRRAAYTPVRAIEDSGVKRSTDLKNLRGLPVDEATDIAREQPHLIKAGDQSQGYYVGGPRGVQSPADLDRVRNNFYDFVAADPRGGDWYDRYRAGLDEINGGDPVRNRWQSAQQGQWSAGVDPGSELQFALRENNGSIAGTPVKSARPAQHEAHLDAIASQDPTKYQLGKKTGEYASRVEPLPEPPPGYGNNGGPPLDDVRYRTPGATGVNDFRHARNFEYTEANGDPQKNAITDASHRFLDHETALAVDHANATMLGGRNDWTGEQVQAAPWVRQKAEDLMSRNPRLSYEDAFTLANRTIADYFDKHTAFGTHEAQPGAGIGHLEGLETAPQAERDAYAADPRRKWNSAPGGRDLIYSGMGIPGTGNYMRVRPSLDMQGAFEGPNGMEFNRGQTARPLVAFETSPETGVKQVAAGDRKLLDASEGLRAFLDANHAGAWHATYAGGPVSESNSLRIPMSGKATPEQLDALMKRGADVGLPHASDTGQGVTMTNFGGSTDSKALGKDLKKGTLADDIQGITGSAPQRVNVDSGYKGYDWSQPGSGTATREMLKNISETPEIRAMMDNHADIPKAALDRLEADTEAQAKYGIARQDIQNARRIISQGPGWVGRLEDALRKGAIALPAAALMLGPAYQQVRGVPNRS